MGRTFSELDLCRVLFLDPHVARHACSVGGERGEGETKRPIPNGRYDHNLIDLWALFDSSRCEPVSRRCSETLRHTESTVTAGKCAGVGVRRVEPIV